MTAGTFALQIHAIVQPFLGSRTPAVLESVCQGMVGVAYDTISSDKLGSLIYWLRIFVQTKKLIDDQQLSQMIRELEALRAPRTDVLARAQ